MYHSILRTTVQWAGRCWVNALDAKNTGRWKTFQEMGKSLHSGGGADKENAMEGATHDPVHSLACGFGKTKHCCLTLMEERSDVSQIKNGLSKGVNSNNRTWTPR